MNRVTVQEAAALLRQRDNFLILTHRRPDGDTTGCAAGLCAALRGMGKTAFLLKNPDITVSNAVYAEPYWGAEDFVPECVVSVDISAKKMFFPEAEAYFDQIDLAVDHHPSFEGFGKACCWDDTKAACGEIVYEICRELGEITQEAALPLYAAVATDTGCFVYANTTANTHRVAAALLETGIDYFPVNKRHFRTKNLKRVALEAAILGNLEFFHEGRGVFMIVSQSLMEQLGVNDNDMENLSSLAGMIEGVDCGALLREQPSGGEWRLNLRTGDNGRVNAADACKLLGGGGHAMAAGAIVKGTLEEVKRQVLEAVDRVKLP